MLQSNNNPHTVQKFLDSVGCPLCVLGKKLGLFDVWSLSESRLEDPQNSNQICYLSYSKILEELIRVKCVNAIYDSEDSSKLFYIFFTTIWICSLQNLNSKILPQSGKIGYQKKMGLHKNIGYS